MTFQD